MHIRNEQAASRKRGPGAIIWDLDGTLVDSSEYHWLAWRATLEAFGHPFTREQFVQTFGLRNDAILRRLLGDRATPEAIGRIEMAKESAYRDAVRSHGIALLPGVATWLRRLQADGWKQGIASSAPKANIEVVLQATQTSHFFQAVVSGEDVVRGKPDPEIFLMAAGKMQTVPGRCVVVEDAPDGIAGARRAGMRSIGLLTPGRSLHGDLNVCSLEELPRDAFLRLVSDYPPGP